VLAFVGGKGGVGRTTTALAVGAALADRGASPVVVDADRDAPDLHAVVGRATEPGVTAVARGARVASVATEALAPGLRVLPARPGVAADTLRAALDRLRSRGVPVLVDCPAHPSRAALPVRLATTAVTVAGPTATACRDAARAARTSRALGTEVLGAVLVGSTDPVAAESALACPTLARVPETDAPLGPAVTECAYDGLLDAFRRQNA
jgi:septum site-determining protein MinD